MGEVVTARKGGGGFQAVHNVAGEFSDRCVCACVSVSQQRRIPSGARASRMRLLGGPAPHAMHRCVSLHGDAACRWQLAACLARGCRARATAVDGQYYCPYVVRT